MEPAKTIAIVCPENLRAGYKNIPLVEFDPAIHVPFDIATGKPSALAPGGLDEGGSLIDIPDDWKSLHWKTRVALAEKLNGDETLKIAEGQTQGDAADAVIEAEVARRAAA